MSPADADGCCQTGTQFTAIGWRYLGAGGSGNLTEGGSYLTLVSDERASDWTMLLQTDGLASCARGGREIAPLQVRLTSTPLGRL